MAAAAGDVRIPIIDIGALSTGDAPARAAVAKEIAAACEDIGFFIIVNHGVPDAVIDGAWAATRDFFDLPLEEKQRMITDDEATYPYGYSKLGGEFLSRGKSAEMGEEKKTGAGDLKEMMAIGSGNPACGFPPRRLPERPAAFAEAWTAYYDSINGLAERLLRAMAIALGMPENWFEDKIDRHISALRANNYPDQAGIEVPAGAIRASAHTDYGTVTVLRSGGPGLQVAKDKENPAWVDVPYVENGFVINLGDLMRRWTNERWVSTLHRVINPPASKAWGRRMSLAFFHNLNKDAVVTAIPSCVTKERPALYDPIVQGEFLMLKHLASMGKADADAHLKKRSPAEADADEHLKKKPRAEAACRGA